MRICPGMWVAWAYLGMLGQPFAQTWLFVAFAQFDRNSCMRCAYGVRDCARLCSIVQLCR